MIAHALELEEDRHFSGIADERLARKERRISHEKAWRGHLGRAIQGDTQGRPRPRVGGSRPD